MENIPITTESECTDKPLEDIALRLTAYIGTAALAEPGFEPGIVIHDGKVIPITRAGF